jgi:hypothetical protein
MPDDGFLLCYVMCVLPDRLPAWGPFPFLRPSLLLRPLRVVVVLLTHAVDAIARIHFTLPEVGIEDFVTVATSALDSRSSACSFSTGVWAIHPAG